MVAPEDGDRGRQGTRGCPTLRIEEGVRGFGGRCLYLAENRQKRLRNIRVIKVPPFSGPSDSAGSLRRFHAAEVKDLLARKICADLERPRPQVGRRAEWCEQFTGRHAGAVRWRLISTIRRAQ